MADNTMEEAKEQATDQAKSMAGTLGEQASRAAEQVRRTGQQLRDAGERVRSAAARGDTAELRRQAEAARDVVAEQGARAGEYITRGVNQYPLTALLIAGAVGYGIAYLVHAGSD